MIVTASTAIAMQGACVALAISALTAGWFDARYRRIPNWLCVATGGVGLAYALWLSGAGAWSNGLHSLIALIVGMVLFRMGIFGGGDAKYYTAVATWFALGQAVLLLLAVTLSGLALLVVWFTARRLAGIPIRRRPGGGMDGLPYGIAIGAGAVISAVYILPSASQVI